VVVLSGERAGFICGVATPILHPDLKPVSVRSVESDAEIDRPLLSVKKGPFDLQERGADFDPQII
jgi:hypothetical protein